MNKEELSENLTNAPHNLQIDFSIAKMASLCGNDPFFKPLVDAYYNLKASDKEFILRIVNGLVSQYEEK